MWRYKKPSQLVSKTNNDKGDKGDKSDNSQGVAASNSNQIEGEYGHSLHSQTYFGSIEAIKEIEREREREENFDDNYNIANVKEFETLGELFSYTHLSMGLLFQAFVNGSFIIFDELFPLFCAELIKYGGLGMTSLDIGIVLAWQSVILVFWPFFIQPHIILKYNLIKSSEMSTIVCLISCMLTPALTFLTSKNTPIINGKTYNLVILLCFLTTFKVAGASILFTSCFCFVNNSVPNLNVGKANGLAQTIASFVRGIGPTFAGFLWSWSTTQTWKGHAYTGYTLSMICFVAMFVILLKMPKRLQRPWEVAYS